MGQQSSSAFHPVHLAKRADSLQIFMERDSQAAQLSSAQETTGHTSKGLSSSQVDSEQLC